MTVKNIFSILWYRGFTPAYILPSFQDLSAATRDPLVSPVTIRHFVQKSADELSR